MKILYFNPMGSVGGAERVLLAVLASVRQQCPGAELHLLSTADGPLLSQAELLGVKTAVLPLPLSLSTLGDSQLNGTSKMRKWLSFLRRGFRALPAAHGYLRQLRQFILQLRPTLIHSNGIKTHLLLGLAGIRSVPVLWHVHDFCGTRPLVPRLLRGLRGSAVGAIAISRAVAEDTRRVLPRMPVRVIYNAIDVEAFTPGPGDEIDLDQLAGLPPCVGAPVRIGMVATYARWKGHAVFLQAARLVRQAIGTEAVRFYVIGGPIYQTDGSQYTRIELEALAAQLGLTGQLGFVGFQQDPRAAFRRLDVVVHASTKPEPFGMTIIEGMACGRAVVATLGGGVTELLSQEHDAFGVPPGDPAALAQCLLRLTADADLRRRLGENARQTAITKFNQNRLGKEILTAYHDAVNPGNTGRKDQTLTISSGDLHEILKIRG